MGVLPLVSPGFGLCTRNESRMRVLGTMDLQSLSHQELIIHS